MTKTFEILNFGHWNLFGIWCLEFGIYPFQIVKEYKARSIRVCKIHHKNKLLWGYAKNSFWTSLRCWDMQTTMTRSLL